MRRASEKEAAYSASLATETAEAVNASANGATLLQLARPLLLNLLHRLQESAQGDKRDYAQLHQVRIAGKRLRYAMEIFAACFADAFRLDAYPRVEEMQEILGRANDSHIAAEHIRALRERLRRAEPAEWKRLRAGIEGTLRFHTARLQSERRRFQSWWRRWTESGSEELMSLLRGQESTVSIPDGAPG
jgi:CHAD domain-containing protein